MRYRVHELAHHAGVSVDTVRFYQGQGLIEPPVREGRIVWYGARHLDRLHRVRRLSAAGFTLAQIKELMVGRPDPLLEALADRERLETVTLNDLAALVGLDPQLLVLGVESGLLQADEVGDQLRFDRTQVEMVETVGRLLDSGVDVDAFVRLAVRHATAIDEVAAEATSLYRDAVLADVDQDRETIATEIELLVPAVTQLVADHFSRALVSRAAAVLAGLERASDARTTSQHEPAHRASGSRLVAPEPTS